jgi:epoxyqueuosine reductase
MPADKPVDQNEVKRALKEESRRLGFQLVGITTPDQPQHFELYKDWLGAGRHAQMAYLAADRAVQRRKNPLLILPECRSILMLGIRHDALAGLPVEHELSGRVAAYAWGADYHDVLPGKMRALVSSLESLLGYEVPNRWYTDTGPVMERDLAQRAGLGWIGKNTCLINPNLGSYFLLGAVLLGLELEPDQPFEHDRCGSCTRCVDACPTACILPDRTIDSRRCISYLTIELKGSMPRELRGLTGDWVFGCDICQQVCPWNQRFAPSRGEAAFSPSTGALPQDLREALKLSPREFNRVFKGSPLKRAKRRGYLRNAAVALGNRRDFRAVPCLAQALVGDVEALVRGHAAWALGVIGGGEARAALKQALVDEKDPDVISEINNALHTL